jgi:hypothetical protein
MWMHMLSMQLHVLREAREIIFQKTNKNRSTDVETDHPKKKTYWIASKFFKPGMQSFSMSYV